MKRIILSVLAVLLLSSCSPELIDGNECLYCDDRYASAYCPVDSFACPDCSAQYGEKCYICGKNCHYHYIEISDPLQILCYSCAEDLLNQLDVSDAISRYTMQ